MKIRYKIFLCLIITIYFGSIAFGQVTEQKGLPVKIASLCVSGKTVDEVAELIKIEGERGVDIIILPETWNGSKYETVEGPLISRMKKLAAEYSCYIVCPMLRKEHEHYYNSSVFIGDDGKIIGIYDKLFPYFSEFDYNPPVEVPKSDVKVFDTKFGKIGFAICFDAKFPELWRRLNDKGADIVIWSSVYSGFTELQAFATQFHYYIVTCTPKECLVYDITGEKLKDYQDNMERGISVSRITLDMDRQIYHYNFNWEKRTKLLTEKGDLVEQVVNMPREEWFVLQAAKPSVSVRKLAKEYGLEELRDYIARSRKEIDDKRGFSFEKEYVYPFK